MARPLSDLQPDAPNTRILLVSAATARRRHWETLLLQRYPHIDIVFAHDGASAVYQCSHRPLVSAVIDSDLPDMNAGTMVAGLRAHQPDLPILMVHQTHETLCDESGLQHCAALAVRGGGDVADTLPSLFSCHCFETMLRRAYTQATAITLTIK